MICSNRFHRYRKLRYVSLSKENKYNNVATTIRIFRNGFEKDYVSLIYSVFNDAYYHFNRQPLLSEHAF